MAAELGFLECLSRIMLHKIITLYVPMVLRLFESIIVIVNQKVRVGPNRSEESKALLECAIERTKPPQQLHLASKMSLEWFWKDFLLSIAHSSRALLFSDQVGPTLTF